MSGLAGFYRDKAKSGQKYYRLDVKQKDCKEMESQLPESEMSSQYGESNSYSAFRICSNSLASFSS